MRQVIAIKNAMNSFLLAVFRFLKKVELSPQSPISLPLKDLSMIFFQDRSLSLPIFLMKQLMLDTFIPSYLRYFSTNSMHYGTGRGVTPSPIQRA